MMKLALMRTATGKEDPVLPLLQRINFIRINCTSDCSPNTFFTEFKYRHISTSTVQRRLRESGLHGQIAGRKPLLKDTNENKRLAWAKKHKQRNIRPVEICHKCRIFGSIRRVFVKTQSR
jgi:hypothetical protein